MKALFLIVLMVAGCAASKPIPITPLFPNCPGLMPTPSLMGKHETISAFEVRIELAREEAVKRHAACIATVAKMQEWISLHQ